VFNPAQISLEHLEVIGEKIPQADHERNAEENSQAVPQQGLPPWHLHRTGD